MLCFKHVQLQMFALVMTFLLNQVDTYPVYQDESRQSRDDMCDSVLANAQQIFHFGDYLLISVEQRESLTGGHKSRKYDSFGTDETMFYLYNWQRGQLYGQPLRQSQLFAFDVSENDPDGELLFASTFDVCSIMPPSTYSQRDKRQSEDYDMLESILADSPHDALNSDAKVGDLDLKDLQGLLQVKQIKSQLESMKRMKALKWSSSLKDELKHRQLIAKMKSLINAQIKAMFTTTAEPTVNGDSVFHEQVFSMMRSLHQQFNNLTHHIGPQEVSDDTNEAPVKPVFGNTIATPLPVMEQSSPLSKMSSPSPTTQPMAEKPQFEEPQHCPRIVIATFKNSKLSPENKFCGDKHHIKSVIFEYSEEANQMPRLTPIRVANDGQTMTKLLAYRGTIRSNGDHFLVVRSDLICPFVPNKKIVYLSGFTLKGKVFMQTKSRRLKEYSTKSDNDWTISELLNCYGTSPVFVSPLKVIGASQSSKYDDEENEYYDLVPDKTVKPTVEKKKSAQDNSQLPVAKQAAAQQVMPSTIRNRAAEQPMNRFTNRLQGAFRDEQKEQGPNYTTIGLVTVAIVAVLYFWCTCCSTSSEEENEQENDKKVTKRKKRRRHRKPKLNDSDDEDGGRKRKSKRNKRESKKSNRKSRSRSLSKKGSKQKEGSRMASVPSVQVNSSGDPQAMSLPQTGQAGDCDRQPVDNKPPELLPLEEVVVIDPNKIDQFCGQDSEMTSRIESMFCESKVIAHCIEMKRHMMTTSEDNGPQAEDTSNDRQEEKDDETSGDNSQDTKQSSSISSDTNSNMTFISKDEEGRLIEVLHRMRRSLKKSMR